MTDSPDRTPPPPSSPPPVDPSAAVTVTPEPAAEVAGPIDNFSRLQADIDAAYAARNDPGRFATGKEYNVAYSGYSANADGPNGPIGPSEVYADALGKSADEKIHSAELALQHAAQDPRAGTIHDTPGGKELDAIESRMKASLEKGDITQGEYDGLNALNKPNWEGGSAAFANDTAAKPNSISYTEHTGPGKVFPEIERPRLEESPGHVSLSNAPLAPDGSPPPQDKIPPHMLDPNGRMYQV